VSQPLQEIMRGDSDCRHAGVGEVRLHSGNLADKHFFKRIGGIAYEKLESLVDSQQRVIEPLEILICEGDFDTVRAFHPIGVRQTGN